MNCSKCNSANMSPVALTIDESDDQIKFVDPWSGTVVKYWVCVDCGQVDTEEIEQLCD